ncbi:hypothetical protein MASR1M48_17490 [Lactococcus petauri]
MVGFTTKSIDFSNPLKSVGVNLNALLAKGSLVNLDMNKTYQFVFNPTEIKQPEIKAVYDETNVMFRSHPRLRYKYTSGSDWVFTLYLSSTSGNSSNLLSVFNQSRNLNQDTAFLQSLVYPISGQGLANRRPPIVRFVWPNIANVRVRVMSVGTTYKKFNMRLQQQVTMIDLVLREDPEKNVTSNLVRERGATGRPGLLGALLDKLPTGVSEAIDNIDSFI